MKDQPCSFAECSKTAFSKGLCKSHYAQRWRGVELKPIARVRSLKGRRFGRLLAVEQSGSNRYGAIWLCVCDCGSRERIQARHLHPKGTQSCGCLASEVSRTLLKNMERRVKRCSDCRRNFNGRPHQIRCQPCQKANNAARVERCRKARKTKALIANADQMDVCKLINGIMKNPDVAADLVDTLVGDYDPEMLNGWDFIVPQ